MKRKNQFLYSVLSLLLCVAMLMGTTYAWFTDSVESGLNTIAAGNLDVELYHSNAAVQNEKVDASTELFMDLNGKDILWEPGVVSYENLRVVNEGDLALAYQLALNTANENYIVDPATGAQYGLSQVLQVGVVEGGTDSTTLPPNLISYVYSGRRSSNGYPFCNQLSGTSTWKPSEIFCLNIP